MAFNADCTWDSISGVDGYNVYLSSDGGSTFTKQNSSLIGTNSYTISDLPDDDYQAYATSVLGGIESQASNIESFSVPICDLEITSVSVTEV